MLRERYLEAHDLVMQAPGPSRTPSRSTAASTSSATSTSGRARSSSRTRRSGSRAAARSRPGSGAPGWTTSTPISPISATRPARRRWTASGTRWTRLGKDRNPYRAGFLQFVGVAESREEAMELLSRAGRVFLRPLPARRSALGDAAGLHHRGDAARRHRRARSAAGGREPAAPATTGFALPWRADGRDIVERGYVIIGSPKEVAEQLEHVAKSSMSAT